jgi:Spy/CpxP family protein refolding chaperone
MSESPRQKHPTESRTGWQLGALLAAAGAAVVLSLNAWAAEPEAARMPAMPADHAAYGAPDPHHPDPHHPGHGPEGMGMMGMGHHGHHGHHGGMGMGMGMMPMDVHHLDKLLSDAKVSEAQRGQIRQINDKARVELQALREQAMAAHEAASAPTDLMGLLSQAKVDAAAAEKSRQQMLAQHDAMSKRMLQTAVDIANVLTPEQRAAIGQEVQKRHAHFMHHHAGMPGMAHPEVK